MAITEAAAAATEREECLADLYQALEDQGANPAHLRAVTDWNMRRQNAEAARLARLYFGRPEGAEISPAAFADRLDDLARRAYGVEAAVSTILEVDDGKLFKGIVELVRDLSLEMDQLSEAYSAELMANIPAPGSDLELRKAFLECDMARLVLERHEGRGNLPDGLVGKFDDALLALAKTPCDTDHVLSKLRYLFDAHKQDVTDWLEEPSPALMAALTFHFGDGKGGEATGDDG